MPETSPAANHNDDERLREVNEALLISSVRLHEQTEKAETAQAELIAEHVRLLESRSMLETALSAGSVATLTWDIVNDRMIPDERMAEMFGVTPDRELPIADFVSVIHPEDRSLVEEQVARTLETDEPYDIEYRVMKGGNIRWVHVRGKIERDAAGQPLHFAAALIDITERKREMDARYFLASIIETSRDSIITVDFDSVITSWNPAAESLYGYPADEAIGKNLSMLLLPEDFARIFGNVNRVRHGEAVALFDTVRVHKDRHRLDLEVAMSPVKDSRGRVVGVSTIVRDRTERIHSEEALRASEQRFRVAVDAMDSLVWTNNARGEMEGKQPGWESFTGQTFEEYQGYGWTAAVHPDDIAATIDAWNTAVSSNATFVFEHRLRNRSGEWRVCSIRAVPVLTQDGEVREWVGAHTDITERRKTEVELRRWREELEQRVQERTAELELANKKFQAENLERVRVEEHRVAILRRLVTAQEDERRRIGRDLHDQIGQQLTALRFKLEELSRDGDVSGSLKEKIEQAQEYAEQMDADASFLSYELRPLGLEELGLRSSVRDFVTNWSGYHGIPAQFHAPQTPLWPLSPEMSIHLYRIVQEALNNILKHARAKGVSVVLELQEDTLTLIVKDDGIGFDPDSPKKRATVSGGLGLVGMRERCDLLGGTMSIESGSDKGTSITCRIPVKADTSAAGN